MRVGITGASGLIGSALVERLAAEGHQVRRLVRRPPASADEATWEVGDPAATAEALRGLDAVVHLAGEPIGAVRWTAAKKERILTSRVEGTATIANAVAQLDDGPRILVSMSGSNYYGDRGDEKLTEESSGGDDFFAFVCRAWEAAADPARAAGARVSHLRTGIVLSREGGALRKLLMVFRLGLGGRFGSGTQWWPWISLEDQLGVIVRALTDEDFEGPYNVVAPDQVTNAQFTRALGRALRRPAVIAVPAFGPRLILGELADILLLGSARLVPARLQAAGFAYRHPTLEEALREVLGR